MIAVDIVLDEDERLASCRIQGHAGAGARGSDVVCAAVSALAMAVSAALRDADGIEARCEAPERGEFFLEVPTYSKECGDYLAGVSSVLIQGMQVVADEYPKHCECRLRKAGEKK